jgi:AraC-like DNA-binding protein
VVVTGKTNAARERWTLWASELETVREGLWLGQELPGAVGVGRTRTLQLEPGLSYLETDYAPCRELAIHSRMELAEPRLVLTVALQGASLFVDDGGEQLVFREGSTTLTAFRSSLGERRYEADRRLTQLRFAMDRAWLDRHFDPARVADVLSPRTRHTVQHRPAQPTALVAAQELLRCGSDPAGGLLQMRSAALSLLCAELQAGGVLVDAEPLRLSARDVTLAQRARDVLSQEFRNPPTIAELARRVGVNPCKLTQLFRDCFRDTPYGVLTEIRMREAYRLLESTRCPVKIAASKVGYGHASNFSAAFTRRFGVAPKSVAKK